jgi:predicted flavoprotein YhiN
VITSHVADAPARWRAAAVCGAGMAGLLSAVVLAEFFERVVLIDAMF